MRILRVAGGNGLPAFTTILKSTRSMANLEWSRRDTTSCACNSGSEWATSKSGRRGRCRAPHGERRETDIPTTCFRGAGLAQMGAGYADDSVRAGLESLRRKQWDRNRGRIGPVILSHRGMYSHALATLAMSEAAALIPVARYRRSAALALKYLEHAQAPDGGWGYEEGRGPGFTPLTGWMVLAADVGRRAGLDVRSLDAHRLLERRLKKWKDAQHWSIGYAEQGDPASRPPWLAGRFPVEHSRTNDAAGLLIYSLCGMRGLPRTAVRRLRDGCLDVQPTWSVGEVDLSSWYFTALMASRFSRHFGKKWHDKLAPVVIRSQKADGSWDPDGPWGFCGGRVYSTAILALTLQAPYLYSDSTRLPDTAKKVRTLLTRASKDADADIAACAHDTLAR